MPKHQFLLCPPTHFGVEYIINPWMEGQINNASNSLAQQQWADFRSILSSLAEVRLLEPQANLPDLVFTANAALVQGKTALLSRFHHPERQGEEPHNQRWLEDNGFVVHITEISFEGAGDALFDRLEPILWFGHGHRSSHAALGLLETLFAAEVVALQLSDPRFYHLDTCFCPLEGGYLLWYQPAFDRASQAIVEARVPRHRRLAIAEQDAIDFACNAVNVDNHVILNAASQELKQWLEKREFTVWETPTGEFLRAGGSTKCMTLRLDEPVAEGRLATV